MKKEYPEWRRIAWRFGRVFLSGFISALSIVLISVDKDDLNSPAPFLLAATLGCLAGGLNALGKYLRDKFGSADKESLVDKLPF